MFKKEGKRLPSTVVSFANRTSDHWQDGKLIKAVYKAHIGVSCIYLAPPPPQRPPPPPLFFMVHFQSVIHVVFAGSQVILEVPSETETMDHPTIKAFFYIASQETPSASLTQGNIPTETFPSSPRPHSPPPPPPHTHSHRSPFLPNISPSKQDSSSPPTPARSDRVRGWGGGGGGGGRGVRKN